MSKKDKKSKIDVPKGFRVIFRGRGHARGVPGMMALYVICTVLLMYGAGRVLTIQ